MAHNTCTEGNTAETLTATRVCRRFAPAEILVSAADLRPPPPPLPTRAQEWMGASTRALQDGHSPASAHLAVSSFCFLVQLLLSLLCSPASVLLGLSFAAGSYFVLPVHRLQRQRRRRPLRCSLVSYCCHTYVPKIPPATFKIWCRQQRYCRRGCVAAMASSSEATQVKRQTLSLPSPLSSLIVVQTVRCSLAR